jgi:hypothetical protein
MNREPTFAQRVALIVINIIMTGVVIFLLGLSVAVAGHEPGPGEPKHAITLDDPTFEGFLLVCGRPYAQKGPDDDSYENKIKCKRLKDHDNPPMVCDALDWPPYIDCRYE